MHGNQCGAWIDGTFVVMGAFFGEIYGSILRNVIDEIDRPIVAELGAGYGKMPYFTLSGKDSCFIDFDLPEILCLASYFLMRSWPEKKALLYGEEEYSEHQHDRYDLIFMPSFEIEKVGIESIGINS